MHALTLFPIGYVRVQNLGDAEGDSGPRPGLWKKVLGVMRLTPEQRVDLLEHRKVLLSQLTEVGRQRHEIITALQACCRIIIFV